jgi:two-component system nitrogen regulation response regulator GlnG
MNHNDITRTSAVTERGETERDLLVLTIVWHPDAWRIGEQSIAIGDTLELARFQPLFCKPGSGLTQPADLPLGYNGISRRPLRISRLPDESVTIAAPESKMAVELNGRAMHGSQTLSRTQIEAGAILGLAHSVLLCLHFMRCLPKRSPVVGLVGVGDAAIRTRDLIRQVAGTDETVLLLGETGTGKEVAARAIHQLSRRADRPLVSVNMAALNEALAAAELFGAAKGAYTGAQNARAGYFQEAQDATLFLDEIGNVPAAVQPMLLRVLETGDYRPLGASRDLHSSARIIAATDQDLYGAGFNQALVRRLESFIISIPPLRARREDIGLLIVHMLKTSTLPDVEQLTLPPQLVSDMANYDWPGNIRQLRHIVKRVLLALKDGDAPDFASLLATVPVRPSHVPDSAPPGTSSVPELGDVDTITADSQPRRTGQPRKKLVELSEADVLAAMQNNDWMIQGAAQELGISRPSMYKLLEAHSQIRHIGQISPEEIALAIDRSNGDIEACAALLKTPAEALRRYLNSLRYRVDSTAIRAPLD